MGYAYLHTDTGKGIDGGVGASAGGLSPGLTFYVQVEDLDQALARAAELGAGKVLQPPSDVPGVGRFAVFADPEGNRVGLWRLP
jgi:predicted enzyme related to lactoylglutathione lyase